LENSRSNINPDAVLVYDPHFIDPSYKSGCYLCATPEDVQALQVNAVCLSAIARPDDLSLTRSFFEQFEFGVLIVCHDPERRAELSAAASRCLPSCDISVADDAAFKDCTTLSELREKHGISALDSLWAGAHELPPYGLVNLASVKSTTKADAPHVRSGVPGLDEKIGGFYGGALSIWSGRRGEGKSTLSGQIVLAAVKGGKNVCAYSGELPKEQYKEWLSLQAAGPDNVEKITTDTGMTMYRVNPIVQTQIDAWWNEHLFLYDNDIDDADKPETILSVFRSAYKRMNCTVFIVDNLMTADLPGEDYYRAQGTYVKALKKFAKSTGTHVHLVAHPRKSDGKNKKADCDNVGGSGDVSNLSDNTFWLERQEQNDIDEPVHSAKLNILKNRDFGVTGSIDLDFDFPSRRYYIGSPRWLCGWEQAGSQEEFKEITVSRDALPF
jgi:twinkle protein